MMKRIGVFETMQKHYQQRYLVAREWKERGGKALGYFVTRFSRQNIFLDFKSSDGKI